jgi:hypothetical protein
MPSNADAPAEVRPLPCELPLAAWGTGADRSDSSSTAEHFRLPLPDETTDAGVEAEALAEGAIEDEIELLEKKTVAEAEGEGEGSAGGEVAGGDEIRGNSVPEVSDISLFAVLTKE